MHEALTVCLGHFLKVNTLLLRVNLIALLLFAVCTDFFLLKLLFVVVTQDVDINTHVSHVGNTSRHHLPTAHWLVCILVYS